MTAPPAATILPNVGDRASVTYAVSPITPEGSVATVHPLSLTDRTLRGLDFVPAPKRVPSWYTVESVESDETNPVERLSELILGI